MQDEILAHAPEELDPFVHRKVVDVLMERGDIEAPVGLALAAVRGRSRELSRDVS